MGPDVDDEQGRQDDIDGERDEDIQQGWRSNQGHLSARAHRAQCVKTKEGDNSQSNEAPAALNPAFGRPDRFPNAKQSAAHNSKTI